MDRISSLPDEILCHILSFLPTKYVVASCILSTRWKHLWASVPILDFDSWLLRDDNHAFTMTKFCRFETLFQNFVSKVMLLYDMPYVRKLRLKYGCYCKSAPISMWLDIASYGNIQELELAFCLCIRGNLAYLPTKFFTSNKLVVLRLSRMPLNVPSSVCLPKLEILELKRIVSLHDNSIQNLISGCHALQELVVKEVSREEPKVLNISILTLRVFSFGYKFELDSMDNPYTFIINAPNLEIFDVKGQISDVFELRNLSALNNACVDLRVTVLSTDDYIVCCHRIYDLLEGISNAKSVTLSGEVVELFCEDFHPSPPNFSNLKFSNLTHLSFGIGFDFCWRKMLAEFIKCSPNLELSMLNNKYAFSVDMKELRDVSHLPLPKDLLFQLKNIMIDELYINFMPEYVEHLPQQLNVLKRLEIVCHCPILLSSQTGLVIST